MSLRDWFAARKKATLVDTEREKREVADGLWTQCSDCHEPLYTKELIHNLNVCPKCGYHFRVEARERIAQLVDPSSFRETNVELMSIDPLGFVDSKPYPQRLREATATRGPGDALITGTATIDGQPISLAVMNFFFMGGSMGSVVGEKLTRTIEHALEAGTPLIVVAASGGARMQEGTLSLMQMAKTSAALARFSKAGGLYITVLTDPTTGGVTASFATLGDILIAEPSAIIGFAGKRVIEATIRQKTPPDFQTAESLMRHGLIDMIVPRPKLREKLSLLLAMHKAPAPVRVTGG